MSMMIVGRFVLVDIINELINGEGSDINDSRSTHEAVRTEKMMKEMEK